MSIEERQKEIIGEFSMFGDWMEKYEYLIDLGKELPLIGEDKKTEEYTIKGCQSQVWLDAELKEGELIFTADSNAIITKGLVALMVRVLSNAKPDEIVDADLYFIEKIGLKEHLSPNRSNGLLAMIKQMKVFGLAFQAKTKQN